MSTPVQNYWKVWLRPNLLTKDVDNDYNAEVSTIGNTAHNTDVARAIGVEGSEIKYDTLLSILNQSDRIKRTFLREGRSVQDGVSHISPRLNGPWLGGSAKYDPTIHKIGLDMSPTAEMREVLTHVGIDVLGVKDSGAFVGLVTDVATGLTDGTITPDDDIIIEGDKLRIAPDGEDGLGIFFDNVNGPDSYQVTHRFTQNDPKKLIVRVPQLMMGTYRLRVVTRFSNSAVLLNEPRTIVYDKTLTVV